MIETRQAMEELARRGGMTERNHDEGLVGHYKRMGVSVETLGDYKKALAAEGVKGTQMEGALGGLLRVVHKMKSEGEDYELDLHLEDYFEGELGLTVRHIEMVEGIARRIVHGMTESDRER